MQETFGDKPLLISQFKKTLSLPRFTTYLSLADDDDLQAIKLYHWNSILSRSLYFYLQGWEIALRNKLNDFFHWKYPGAWPYDDQKFFRNLIPNDKRRLSESRDRQERERNQRPATVANIAADLSAGFWVSMLSAHYDTHYGWQRNRVGKSFNSLRVFPHDAATDVKAAYPLCDRLLTLRNRVAHHEPIIGLPLQDLHADLRRLVNAMCPATYAYCEVSCDFAKVFAMKPEIAQVVVPDPISEPEPPAAA